MTMSGINYHRATGALVRSEKSIRHLDDFDYHNDGTMELLFK